MLVESMLARGEAAPPSGAVPPAAATTAAALSDCFCNRAVLLTFEV